MKQIIETKYQVYSTDNMCYVKFSYFLFCFLNIADHYHVSKSDKDFNWRNTSKMLNTVVVSQFFVNKKHDFYREFLWIFFFNFLFTGTAENRLIKHDKLQCISLVFGLSISILINLIFISCGILLCRYFLTSRYN